jgi:hypothetical protein
MFMAGDAKFPQDSVRFELLDGLLQNAFREFGIANALTRPMSVTLMQIEHI